MSTTAIRDTRLGQRIIPEEIRPLVGEFIGEIGEIPSLLCVILYGSAARNELHDESDLDLLLILDTDHRPELGDEQRMVARICIEAATRANSFYDFSFIVANLHQLETMDSSYLENVFREGIIIWAQPGFVLPLNGHGD